MIASKMTWSSGSEHVASTIKMRPSFSVWCGMLPITSIFFRLCWAKTSSATHHNRRYMFLLVFRATTNVSQLSIAFENGDKCGAPPIICLSFSFGHVCGLAVKQIQNTRVAKSGKRCRRSSTRARKFSVQVCDTNVLHFRPLGFIKIAHDTCEARQLGLMISRTTSWTLGFSRSPVNAFTTFATKISSCAPVTPHSSGEILCIGLVGQS
mmetsp:Transcript_15974/g.40540  ORF Transcript_15974/g.40540 Transcript_15974/m.40540 type:complete len:209 (-) Transcript_15974:521-1147(-)